SLRMRPRTAAATMPAAASPAAPAASAPAPTAAPATPPTPDLAAATRFERSDDAIGLVRDLRRPISVRFNLGYVVDGTTLTGDPTLDGRVVSADRDFRLLRAYALGEGYFSSRGVLAP